MGFPHVVQLARVERIRELKSGKQEAGTVWLITSLRPEQADAARLLELARQYWEIENGTQYRLDFRAALPCHPAAEVRAGLPAGEWIVFARPWKSC
jgi:hypothetical protein